MKFEGIDLMNEQRREKETLKKQKKIILIVIASLMLFAILYFLISMVDFDNLFSKDQDENNNSLNINFYDESLSKYPSDDEWYMNEAYKNIEYYYGSGTVFSETILTEEDAKSHGEAFYLLYNLIDYIKAGDHESYNACFSSYYFKTSQPQGKFTKQKIYDIIITELPTESKSADGVSFMEYNYTIEYRIRHNNGSFRRDIGSDQSKKQYVKLSERSGEGVLIDRIYTVTHTVVD